MKRLALILALLLGLADPFREAHAAVLDTALPAYATPAEGALSLGTAPVGARLLGTTAPAGWAAVELPGPHAVFVAEKDTLKNFEVRPGAAYYAAPSTDAPVIGLAGEADRTEFADVEGRFNKFSLAGPVTAYVRLPGAPASTPLPVTSVATETATNPSTPPPLMDDLASVLPSDAPALQPNVSPGRGLEAGEPRLARTFHGVVASTRNPLRPRRPYDYQLNDSGGSRIAYLDISRLLLTERMDAYLGRPVFILGSVASLGTGKELVIQVDSLKLQ